MNAAVGLLEQLTSANDGLGHAVVDHEEADGRFETLTHRIGEANIDVMLT